MLGPEYRFTTEVSGWPAGGSPWDGDLFIAATATRR